MATRIVVRSCWFMSALECPESSSAAPDTLRTRNTDARNVSTEPASSSAEAIAFPWLGNPPAFKYYDERTKRGAQDQGEESKTPRKRSGPKIQDSFVLNRWASSREGSFDLFIVALSKFWSGESLVKYFGSGSAETDQWRF